MTFLKHFHEKKAWLTHGHGPRADDTRMVNSETSFDTSAALMEAWSWRWGHPSVSEREPHISSFVKHQHQSSGQPSWQNDQWVFMQDWADWAADDRNLHKPVHQLLVPFLLIQHWINPAGDLKGQWLRSEKSCFVCENLMLLVFSKYLKSKF